MVMKLNSPIPQTLPKECSKAAKIFQSFVDSGNNGLDGVIPRAVLESAKGFAIFTIFKAGFLFSARAGSGIVIAKLEDGSWSSPSAIGTAGVGIGSQLGAEMTDFLVVLNTRSAITSFMAAGSLTLGGNMSLALGPLGRTGEAIGSVNSHGKVAAMYSYSKTRGLFGGVSIEGSVIVERQDANVQAYKSPVTARILLGGMMDPPEWAAPLIKTLEACTGLPGNRQWIQEQRRDTTYAFGGLSNPGGGPSYLRKKKKSDKPAFPPASWGKNKNGGSYFASEPVEEPTHSRSMSWDQGSSVPSTFETRFESDFPNEPQSMPQAVRASTQPDLLDSPNSFDYSKSLRPSPHFRSMSLAAGLGYPSSNEPPQPSSYPYQSPSNPFTKPAAAEFDDSIFSVPPAENHNIPAVKPEPRLTTRLPLHEGVARAIALFDFKAVESGDLSFSKGDIITITQKSESSDDWWTGKLETREGIFPANFVEVL